ncbi:hypothetical protein KBY75_15035 [Cyanobium sp. T1G-Tous]|nr:hypothetical protein [Cyanobium sp. T1G-Tous]MCP9804869.1 hypothetical protein [Cyanobium sp. T1G-Tous]
MQEVRLHPLTERPGHLEAQSDTPALHHGSAHGAYRVRVQRRQSPAALCC